MTGTFEYSTTGQAPRERKAPLWPNLSHMSPMAQKMRAAKQRNGEDFWPVMREVFAQDLKTLPIERVLAWASVWTVPLLSNGRFSEYMREALIDADNYLEVRHAISQPIGAGVNAEDLQTLRVLDDIPATMNRITMYGHLSQTGLVGVINRRRVEDLDTIVEIGAGIGDMADVCRKLGFKGRYTTYDFPELLEMQSRYHQLPGMAMEGGGNRNNIYTSDPSALSPADLVICTYSLTEMPLPLRMQLLKRLKGSRQWLCAYSNKLLGFDNEAWVKDVMLPFLNDKGTYQVACNPIPYMPWDGGCNYLLLNSVVG